MEKNELLVQLANSLNAVVKINALRSSQNRDSGDISVRPSDINMIYEILKTIATYSPERYKSTLNNSVELSNYYINSCKKLKEHLITAKSRSLASGEIIKTLEMFKPILSNKHKSTIEKIQRVYEIIYS